MSKLITVILISYNISKGFFEINLTHIRACYIPLRKLVNYFVTCCFYSSNYNTILILCIYVYKHAHTYMYILRYYCFLKCIYVGKKKRKIHSPGRKVFLWIYLLMSYTCFYFNCPQRLFLNPMVKYCVLSFFIASFLLGFHSIQEWKIEKEWVCSKIIDVPLGFPHENALIIAEIPLI